MRDNQAIKKRLYKSKHGWNVAAAGMLTAGAAATLGVMGQAGQVHADVASPAMAQATSTQAGAVTATSAATTTVGATTNSTPVSTAPVTQNSGFNTANAGLQSAVMQEEPVINQAGGQVTATAPQVGTTPTEVQSETTNVVSTGSADSAINMAVSGASAPTSAVGGQIQAGSSIDVSSLSPESIANLGQVQADRITETGVANGVISGAVASNSGIVAKAGGSLVPGSVKDVSNMDPKEIASAVSKAQQMVEATGSADSVLVSASDQYTSNINAAGGQLKKSDAINTAWGMTPSDVDSSVKSQVTKISTVASADDDLLSAVKSGLPVVNQNGGKLSAGSVIDASKLDPTVIASMVAAQSTMISATAQADHDVNAAKNAVASAVIAVGGVIKTGSHVNTADKMTKEQVLSLAASNVANLQATGKVDGTLASLLGQYSAAIKSAGAELKQGSAIDVSSMTAAQIDSLGSQLTNKLSMAGAHDVDVMSQAQSAQPAVSEASGVMKPGSVIDITNWTVSEVQSEMNQQSAMISVTASGDVYLTSLAKSASPTITGVGGTISQNGVINTADNMTVSDVESSVKSQADLINETVNADSAIASAVKANSGAIAGVSGVETPGSMIDVSSMTISQVMSIASHQVAMVNATGSADVAIKSVGDQNAVLASAIGGFIKQNGLINTANNMTVDQIAQSVKSQTAILNAVGNGDQKLNSAVSAANALSKQFGGGVVTGSAIDVTSMTVQQIGELVDSQVVMASAVGANNAALLKTQSLVSDVVNAVGGTVKAGSALDVSSMTLDQVKSLFVSEQATLSSVGDGDRQIGSAVTNNMNAIQNAGGKILSAGAINMAGKSAAEIQSNAKSQASNIVAAGQFDTKVPSAVSQYAPQINTFGGQLTKSAAIDVSTMSGSEVLSLMNSKVANLSAAAYGNPALSKAESQARSAIEAFGGTLRKGSAIDVSSMDAKKLVSLVNSEVTVMSAAAAMDQAGKSAVDRAEGVIKAAGGKITRGSDVAAQKMVPEQIKSLGLSQVDNVNHVGSADMVITSAMSSNQSAIHTTVNGQIHVGSAVDAHSMTNESMASLAQSNVNQLSLTGSGDLKLGSTINATKDVIKNNGGDLTSAQAIDVSSMDATQIDSLVQSQQQNMQATAGGDQMLTDAAGDVAKETTTRGGAVDVSTMTSQAIGSVVASQVAKIGETQNGNDQIHTAVKNTKGHITEIGGKLYVTSMTDTTKMTSEGIASLVASQTGKLDETATANDMTSTAIQNNSGAIAKHGGWIHQGSELVMNTLASQAGVSHVKSQVAHLNATGSAAAAINSVVDARTVDITREGATISNLAPKDVTSMTDSQIQAYGSSVVAHINHTADGDNSISQAIHGHGNGVKISGTIDVTGKTDAEIDSLTKSIANDVLAVDSYNNSVTNLATSLKAQGWNVTVTSGSSADGSAVSSLVSQVAQSVTSAQNSASAWVSDFNSNVAKQPVNLNLQANGYTALNTWQNVNMGTPNLAYSTGEADFTDGKDTTITFFGRGISASNVISTVDIRNCPVEVVNGGFIDGGGTKGHYNPTDYLKSGSGLTGLKYVSPGTTLRFKGAVTYSDAVVDESTGQITKPASKDDLVVRFIERNGGDGSSGNWPIQVWTDSRGAVNSYVRPNVLGHNRLSNQMTFTVGSGKQVVWPVIIDDIDEGQELYTNITTDNGAFVGVGGGLNVTTYDLNGKKGLKAYSIKNLGDPGIGKNWNKSLALDGIRSEPDGSAALYVYDSVFDETIQNVPDGDSYGVASAVFGKGASFKAEVAPEIQLKTVTATVPSLSTNYSGVATNYTPYSAQVTDHLNYTYSPLKTSWKALDVTTTPLSTQYRVFSDDGGYNPLNDSWSPVSTSFHALSDDGGYHPETYTVSPLGATYQGYDTDGQAIAKEVPSIITDGHGGFKLNPKFTGYAPLSITYQGYESDGQKISKDVPPTIPDPKNPGKMIKNPKFTGYMPFTTTLTPLSTSSLIFDSDGSKIPPVIPDGNGGYKPNPKFTGYAPFSTDYHPYSSDSSKQPGNGIPGGNQPGGTPEFSGYQPYGLTYNPLSTKYHYGLPKVTPTPETPEVPSSETPEVPVVNEPIDEVPDETPVVGPELPTGLKSAPVQESGQPAVRDVAKITPQVAETPVENSPAENVERAVTAPVVSGSVTEPVVAQAAPQVTPQGPALTSPSALPQTGYRHSMAALAGVAMMALTMSVGLIARRKRQ